MNRWKRAIAIDFDGTLCENEYPDIGEPNWNVIYQAIQEQKHGAGIILWTCREGELLYNALEACAEWGLYFDAINDTLPEWKDHFGSSPRKIGADEYWDDKAVSVKNGVLLIDDNEKLTSEDLRKMDGEPVWCSDLSRWCIVKVDDYGELSGTPFILWYDGGATFTWNIEEQEPACYRNKVVK